MYLEVFIRVIECLYCTPWYHATCIHLLHRILAFVFCMCCIIFFPQQHSHSQNFLQSFDWFLTHFSKVILNLTNWYHPIIAHMRKHYNYHLKDSKKDEMSWHQDQTSIRCIQIANQSYQVSHIQNDRIKLGWDKSRNLFFGQIRVQCKTCQYGPTKNCSWRRKSVLTSPWALCEAMKICNSLFLS